MRLASLIGPDLLAALESDPESVAEALTEMHPEDLAEVIEDLKESDALALIRALPSELAADILERLSMDLQVDLIEALERQEAVELVAEMDPDDAVDVVQELNEKEARELLRALEAADPEAAEDIRELILYGPETAGGKMTPEFVALAPDTKVWEAIEQVRELARSGDVETIYSIYVCQYGGKLLGVVSLRELILSDASQTLGDIMNPKVVRIEALADQEEAADLIKRYDLTALPVVDEHETLIGVVTVDDVMDVVDEEAVEDAQKQGGVVPLEESYFATGFFEFVWKRSFWLVILFLGQLLTATVIENNAALLNATIALAAFIPLIISSGGNAGGQSSTLVITGMAMREIEPKDWWRILARELGIGVALGVTLGLMGFVRGFIGDSTVEPVRLGLAVGLSILAIVTMGTIVGAVLPLLLKRANIDPAISSAPLVTSIVDILGLMVYFGVAQLVLNWAL